VRALALLLALFFQPAPPPVPLSATFVTSTSAVVSWQQPAEMEHGITCLVRYYGAEWPAGICWNDLAAGPVSVALPGIYLRPFYQPAIGDRYELHFNGARVGSATLGEAFVYTTYLPLTQQSAPPLQRAVYLPWAGR
jgi:hypothetical protein